MATKKTTAPLFRGATKPAMIMGVPFKAFGILILPIFVGIGLSLFIGQWGYLLFFVPVISIPLVREITKQDDQYLSLIILDLLEKVQVLFNNKTGDTYVLPPRTIRKKELID